MQIGTVKSILNLLSLLHSPAAAPHSLHLHHRGTPAAQTFVLVERVKHQAYGNVTENGAPVRGVALRYEQCSMHHAWPAGVKKVELGHQEFLVPASDPDDTRQVCDLRVSFEPYIFVIEKGRISTFPRRNELSAP